MVAIKRRQEAQSADGDQIKVVVECGMCGDGVCVKLGSGSLM